jgi:hypothetical protein
MTIQCEDLDQMLDVAYGLLCRGACFHACATSLTVTLTGGY